MWRELREQMMAVLVRCVHRAIDGEMREQIAAVFGRYFYRSVDGAYEEAANLVLAECHCAGQCCCKRAAEKIYALKYKPMTE